MNPAAAHVEDRLLEFAYGELSSDQARGVEAHVAECPSCREALAEIRGVRQVMAKLPQPAAPQAGLESLLAYAEQAARRTRAGAPLKPTWWRRWIVPVGSLTAALTFGIIAHEVSRAPRLQNPREQAIVEKLSAKEESAEPVAAPSALAVARDEAGAVGGEPIQPVSQPETKRLPPSPGIGHEYANGLGASPARPASEGAGIQARGSLLGGTDRLAKQDAPAKKAAKKAAVDGIELDRVAKEDGAVSERLSEGRNRGVSPTSKDAPKAQSPGGSERRAEQKPQPAGKLLSGERGVRSEAPGASEPPEAGAKMKSADRALGFGWGTPAAVSAPPAAARPGPAGSGASAGASSGNASSSGVRGAASRAPAAPAAAPSVHSQRGAAPSVPASPSVERADAVPPSAPRAAVSSAVEPSGAAASDGDYTDRSRSAEVTGSGTHRSAAPAPTAAPSRVARPSAAPADRSAKGYDEAAPAEESEAVRLPDASAQKSRADTARIRAEALSQKAVTAQREGSRALEARYLREALATGIADPNLVTNFLLRLCDAELALGNLSEGRAACERVVREFPSSPAAAVGLRRLEQSRAGRAQEAQPAEPTK